MAQRDGEDIVRIGVETDTEKAEREFKDLGNVVEKTAEQIEKADASLRGAAGATEQLSSAEGELAQAAARAGREASTAGEVAAESAQQAAAAARQHETAIDDVAAANRKAEASAEALAAEFSAVTFEIRNSGATLESQKTALLAYASQLEKLATEYRAAGEASKGMAEVAENALRDVRGKIDEVSAAMRRLESGRALSGLRDDVVSTDQAFSTAVETIRKVQEEIKETGRVGPRSIGFAAQAVENYRRVVDETADLTDEARAFEIARLDKLKTALDRVNQTANRLTNESKDNAVRLKETGNQVAGVGLAVQDLTRDLGPAGKAFGDFAGRAGIYAANFEQLKDAIGGVGKGAIGFIGQLALIAAAATGTVKVINLFTGALKDSEEGQKRLRDLAFELAHRYNAVAVVHKALTDAQEKNTESSRILYTSMGSVLKVLERTGDQGPAMKALADRIEGAAKASSELSKEERDRLAIIVDLLRRGKELTAGQKDFVTQLASQIRYGRDASGVLNTLIRLSLSYESATRGTSEKLRESFEVLRQLTDQQGLHSQKTRQQISDTQRVLDATDGLTEAQRRNHQRTLDGLRAIDAARQQSQQLETARVTALVTGENEVADATLRTARAVQGYLIDLEAVLSRGGAWGGVLRDLAGQLAQVTGASVTLNDADRGRLEVIAELLAKGRDLTDSQRALAAELIAQAKAGTETTTALNTVARIQGELDIAVGGSTQKIADLTGALDILIHQGWDVNSVAIAKAIGELNSAVTSTDGLATAQRKLYEEIAAGHAKISSLQGSLKSLRERSRELIDELAEASAERGRQIDEEYRKTQAQIRQAEDRIASEQGVIAVTTQSVAAMNEQAKAQANVKESTFQLVKEIIDGKVHWKLIQTAQEDAATSAEGLAAKTTAAADKIAADVPPKTAAVAGAITSVGTAATDAADTFEKATDRIANPSELSAASQQWLAETAKIRQSAKDAATDIDSINDRIKDLMVNMDALDAKVEGVYRPTMERIRDYSNEAAGDRNKTESLQ